MSSRPPRLQQIRIDCPLFLITFNTRDRAPLLARPEAHEALLRYAEGAEQRGIFVGRFVIMPDHLHLFVASSDFNLEQWVRGLKRVIAAAIDVPSAWQTGFHDHLLRSDESYEQKWLYVRENPVGAGLVTRWSDWSYQGEPVRIERG